MWGYQYKLKALCQIHTETYFLQTIYRYNNTDIHSTTLLPQIAINTHNSKRNASQRANPHIGK